MLCCDEAEKLEDIYRAHKLFQGLAFEDPGALDLSMGECFHCRGTNNLITQLAKCKKFTSCFLIKFLHACDSWRCVSFLLLCASCHWKVSSLSHG